MAPHELIDALVRDTKMPLLQVAIAMDKAGFQSTLHKFVNGQIVTPTRQTAKKIADYFNLPVDALYDSKLATQIAFERGITAPAPRTGGTGQVAETIAMRVAESTAAAEGYAQRPIPLADLLPSPMIASIRGLNAKQRKGLVSVIDAYLTAIDSGYQGTKVQSA